MSFSSTIRLARPDDSEQILAIYNEAVRTTTATLDTDERDIATQQLWMQRHSGDPYPCFVAENQDGVVGWASLSPYNTKPGYRATAENSLYVAQSARGQGIGEALLRTLLADAPTRGIHTIIALITGDNTASLRLHEKLGFRTVGTLERVGRKFDQDIDVTLMQWSMP